MRHQSRARAGELTSRVRIYRGAETRDEYGDVAAGWTDAGTLWMGFTDPSQRLADYGAGEQEVGTMLGTARHGSDLRERDGLEVLSGPEEGSRYRVQSVFKGRHATTAVLERFNGGFV